MPDHPKRCKQSNTRANAMFDYLRAFYFLMLFSYTSFIDNCTRLRWMSTSNTFTCTS